ncbi:MAG TPA: 2-amino-4-hydroxy-6-hydroxymethyldihydropteridine diphosphokinase [Dehalococcoidia bacterium]|nr:2-amino-4-hydroxy-6-hydroxymethyldihydropteridine diphosphokinase [Dehalococcoidia bacterium]
MASVTAYLGLGSNLGQREANLAQAVHLLSRCRQMQVLRSSSIYETEPWGFTDQPPFLNAVVEVSTNLEPASLLELAKTIETEVGREPTFRWGPRLVDLDILLYADQVIQQDNPDLQIPHPRISQRAFVLVPLAEVASDLLHPTLRVTVGRLAEDVEGKEGVRLWGPPIQASDRSNA